MTYLPGAQPSVAAQQALARVNAVPRQAGRTEESLGGAERTGEAEQSGRDRKATRASNVAIHQLARRGMSRWELEQVLAKREVDDETAAAELDRLESLGLVDDAALAVSVVYAMHARKGAGRAAIEQELRRRHLDDDVIADAMAELDGDDEKERATELAVARARQLTGYDYEVASRRLSGFLARKGYDGETVRAAVRTALESHPRGPSNSGGRVRFR
ncbi:regulatory protein RecX [Humibacter soli]